MHHRYCECNYAGFSAAFLDVYFNTYEAKFKSKCVASLVGCCDFCSTVLTACPIPRSDEKKARSDDKAQLLALPEPRHAVYTCIAVACGVVCFANGTGLSPYRAAALAALPSLGESNHVYFSLMTACGTQL